MLYMSVDHPAIACRDVQKQIDFYCQAMGMHLIAGNGQEPASVVLGYGKDAKSGAMVELMPARDPGPDPHGVARFQPGLRHLAFRVEDFDEAYRKLKERGIVFLFEPAAAIGGGKIVSFRDPEGNELQIVQR